MPENFWDTQIGELIGIVLQKTEDWITISEAALILRGENKTKASLIAVGRMIERGELECIYDPREPNKRRARRVRRADVEALKAG